MEYLLAKYSTEHGEVPIYGEEWLEKRNQTLEQAKASIRALQTYGKGPGEKVPDWGLLERSIYGIDVSRQMMRIAMMNLVLHCVRNARVKRANALSELGGLTEDDLHRKYRVILSNPPFAGMLPQESIRKDLPTNSKKSELLFLGVMMEALAPGGRRAVVVPEGLLFGSTKAHVDLRRKLMGDYDLLGVISLPAGVFKPYAGVKTGVLVFRKPITDVNGTQMSGNVWFYEVRNDGYDTDKIVGGGRPETPQKNDIPDLLRQWKLYRESGFKNPPGVETGILLQPGSEEPRCWWASGETIAENNYSLVAGRYKPQVAEQAPEEDPAELIREVLTLERPALLNNWKDFRYFTEKFGVSRGRIIARYPKRWKRLVYESLVNCGEIERKRIEEGLSRLGYRLLTRHCEWNTRLDGLANAEVEHLHRPFHAILAKANRICATSCWTEIALTKPILSGTSASPESFREQHARWPSVLPFCYGYPRRSSDFSHT